MSVEKVGPQGYEWQYRVTSLVGLQNPDAAELRVEIPGNEDATLAISEAGIRAIVEIQAKSSKKVLTDALLSGWLAHYPSHKSTGSLIERLWEGRSRAVLIAGGPCTDVYRPLRAALGTVTLHRKVTPQTAEAILAALVGHSEKPARTKLLKKRNEDLASLCEVFGADIKRFTETLQRVIIWDETIKTTIDDWLVSELKRSHKIPEAACGDAVRTLDEIIRNARDRGGNALPEIKKRLRSYAADSLFPPQHHFPRHDQDGLHALLKEKQVCLLMGRSKCGKTHLARYLAQQMQDTGAHADIGNDPLRAYQFLTEPGTETRLFLLDDPFNSANPEDLSTIKATLRQLVGELRSHRFLIVTSTTDRVLPLAGLLAPHRWIDLSISDPAFVRAFWKELCRRQGVPKALEEKLEEGIHILPAGELPQPGHLSHLSRQDPATTEGLSAAELFHMARFDARLRAEAISSRGTDSIKLHFALCMGATTVQPLPMKELEYLLSGITERPGFLPNAIRIVGPDETQSFPSAPEIGTVQDVVMAELRNLERKGHIRTRSKEIEFSHPDHLLISKEVIASCSSLDHDLLFGTLECGLASLDETTGITSAGILDLVFQHHGHDEATRNLIFGLAERSTRSILPAVRDAVSNVIIGWLPDLERKLLAKALSTITRSDPEDWSIRWEGEIPWIVSSTNMGVVAAGPQLRRTEFEDSVLNLLAGPAQVRAMGASQAWDVAHFLEKHPTAENAVPILLELMKQPHAFIRAKAISLLSGHYINGHEAYLKVLQRERNPRVLGNAITAIFMFWSHATASTRRRLSQWMKEMLMKPPIATACSGFLVYFGSPYKLGIPRWDELPEKGRRELWTLWASLFSIYLATIANQPFSHNGPHMYRTVDVSRQHLAPADYSTLLESWITWIEGHLEMYGLDEYELSAADFLVRDKVGGTKRKGLLSKMLGHRNTGLAATTAAAMTDGWSHLSDAEKQLLKSALQKPRKDARWLKAVVVTRRSVPPLVQEWVLGKQDAMAGAANAFIADTPSDLLSDAVHVFCGRAEPFADSFSFSSNRFWTEVILALIANPNHRDFDLAVRTELDRLPPSKARSWNSWKALCDAGEPVRRKLFQHLLACSVEINGFDHNGSKGWKILFSATQDQNEKIRYVDGILENLEEISTKTDFLGILVGTQTYKKYIHPKLAPEIRCAAILRELSDSQIPSRKKILLTELEGLLQNSPPRMLNLLHAISRVINGSEVATKDVTLALDAAFVRFQKNASLQRERFRREY